MGLEGRRILLGVTGGIAAYKTPLLARLMVTAGAEVRAVMTAAASRFVTATTLTPICSNAATSSPSFTSASGNGQSCC